MIAGVVRRVSDRIAQVVQTEDDDAVVHAAYTPHGRRIRAAQVVVRYSRVPQLLVVRHDLWRLTRRPPRILSRLRVVDRRRGLERPPSRRSTAAAGDEVGDRVD